MKHVLIILGVIGIAILLQSNMTLPNGNDVNNIRKSNIEMPADVKAVVDKACYGCHHKESRNEKGRAKLSWDGLDDLSKAKQVASMERIIEVIKEDAMPPKKFKENYPDNVPSKDELKKVTDWANAVADKILGE